jgi:predicted hotdog family 3-hydroxylacyl-ACP dehydratase
MIATGDNILTLIPQRPPMVMIDALVSAGEERAESTLVISNKNIFIKNGILREPGLVENIAQTAAARIGYICRQEKKPVPIGFIGAVQKLVIHKLPGAGKQIKTIIEIKNQVMNVTIITGTIWFEGDIIAQCEMKIFLTT